MHSVLSEYNRSIDDVLFICSDNRPTNKKLCRILKKPMIGCFSHLLNLAAKQMLLKYEESIIKPIEKLMSKLASFKKWAILSRKTQLRPVLRNCTRWSSTFDMIERYLDYTEPNVLLNMEDTEIENLKSIIDQQKSELTNLVSICKKLMSATLGLQRSDADLWTARRLFDQLIIDFPDQNFSKYLARDAPILTNSEFLDSVYQMMQYNTLLNCQQ